MATRSEENRRKQQALINAGYRGVVADGSWGPYLLKLWLHYLANSLGPTKQQRIDRAKQNNLREALIARNYFSLTPSIGNLARGVYHWWNSIPAFGGLNESGVLEYNVASNPIVAAASPGGGIAKTGQLAKTAKEGYTRGKRLFGFLGRKNTISGNPRQTAFGRTLVDNAEDAEILSDTPKALLTSRYAVEAARNAANQIWNKIWTNHRVYKEVITPEMVEKAKKMASKTPELSANNVKVIKDSKSISNKSTTTEENLNIPEGQTGASKASNTETSSVNNETPSNNGTPPNNPTSDKTSNEGFSLSKIFWEKSNKPSTSKHPNFWRNVRNIGIRVPAYIGAASPVVDVAGNIVGAGLESEDLLHLWKFPVTSFVFTPARGLGKVIEDAYSTKPTKTEKAPVEDDWLKLLDEAGKNVGY